MPYTTDSDNLPSNVKKMSANKRSQWVEIFNSSISAGDDEATAFKKANGGVKKKGWPDSWDVSAARVSAETAEYDPFGAKDGKGCPVCNWFISPDSCANVYGDICATGMCELFLPEPVWEPEPMPVRIVKELNEESLFSRILDKVKEFLGLKTDNKVEGSAHSSPVHPLVFYKDSEGNLRFFATVSNNFKDRQSEIITSEAHKEYVEWVDRTKDYPKLWLWHSGPQSEWGQVDWVDYADGFYLASGKVHPGKEYIAEALENQEIGVSHGFVSIPLGKDIVRYRDFEISALPLKSAANIWTDFTTKEIDMPFSPEKKAWLKDVAKVDDAVVTAWEASVEGLSKSLKDSGVDYKESTEPNFASEIAALTKAVSDVAALVSGIKTELATVKETADAASKSLDDKVAEAFTAQIAKMPQPAPASESKSNIVGKSEEPNSDISWFYKDVVGRI